MQVVPLGTKTVGHTQDGDCSLESRYSEKHFGVMLNNQLNKSCRCGAVAKGTNDILGSISNCL